MTSTPSSPPSSETPTPNPPQSTNSSPTSALSKMPLKLVGEAMKDLESSACSCALSNTKPIIFRLDGHKFATYARSFRKPFDVLLHDIMIETCKDLMDEFAHITTVYTMSDEITLYMPVTHTKTGELVDLAYGGRLIKSCTLMAGYASSRFNFHAVNFLEKWTEKDFSSPKKYEQLKETIKKSRAYFDARAHNLDSDLDALYNILWRCLYDCGRNSKNNLGRAHFSAKQLHGLKSNQVVQKLMKEKNVDWNACHPGFKYGTTLKKKRILKESVNPKTGESIEAVRSTYLAVAFKYEDNKEWVQMLNAKYWDDLSDELFAEFLPNETKVPAETRSEKKDRSKKRKRNE